ncbi:MAG: sugar ABC transporter permease [Spirochaetaceae bacterium]|nr:sugar ABC transporter permease [Spirochaetaceae bacterium]
MILPAIALLVVFNYIPIYGIVIAFQDYMPAFGFNGSPWVGLKWFRYLLDMPDFIQITINTLVIAVGKIVFVTAMSVFFALLLHEVHHKKFKKAVQTSVYLPHFFSWVIVGGIFVDLLSLDGLINQFLTSIGFRSPVFFLGDNRWFRTTMISLEIWKSFGWGAIIYLAAISNINPNLYESSSIDGANRFQQARYITIPGIGSTIILLATLSLGNVLNAGFEQIFVMYNEVVYQTGDIIDTFVYRTGLMNAQFSLSTAVGLAKSVVSFVLIGVSYRLAYKYANYRIF